MWDICQKVSQGGLFIVHSLIVALGCNFEQHIPVIGPYLVAAIENHQDENAARFACGLVSDLSNYLEKNMSSYIDQFMNSVNNVLKKSEFSIETKIHAMIAVGDLCLATEENF
jgi:hypothetical protein